MFSDFGGADEDMFSGGFPFGGGPSGGFGGPGFSFKVFRK